MSLLSACLLASPLFAQAPATFGELNRFYDGSREALAPPPVSALPFKKASASAAETQPAAQAPAAPARGAFSGGYVGLKPESEYELITGRSCAGCRAPREGLWYFLDDVLAVPKAGTPHLVWIGSNQMIEGAMLSADGNSITLPSGETLPLSLVPKIAQNQSFYDLSTASFYKQRPLRLRGEIVEENGRRRFVARTIWPEDWRLDVSRLRTETADSPEDWAWLLNADDGGARAAFNARVIWERQPGARAWAGKPVMGLMLNGGQGDDDETQAGHFSFFAGRVGPNGEMSDWLFSNFYDMDLVSEKGITAALVPMDKYMADLNSGQSFYRPSYLAVAILRDGRVPERLQERYREAYRKYYAHEVKYDRAEKACTALIIDDLREEGWNIPKTGPSDPVSTAMVTLAMRLAGGPQAAADVRKFLRQERSRLYPRAGFEQAANDLVSLAKGPQRRLSALETMLRDDLEAVLFVLLPQIPSSRAFGREPVASTEEYFWRAPWDRSKWKTVPNASRPFPPVPVEER